MKYFLDSDLKSRISPRPWTHTRHIILLFHYGRYRLSLIGILWKVLRQSYLINAQMFIPVVFLSSAIIFDSKPHLFSKCKISSVNSNRDGNWTVSLSYPLHWVFFSISLNWRHNVHDGVSNHQPHGCLFNRLFRRRSKKISKLRVNGLCAGNSPGPLNSPHKGTVTRKLFPFYDVIKSQFRNPTVTSHPECRKA